MTLISVRHKPSPLLLWLFSLLTFYLGFDQQVMCFELHPTGQVCKVHLQLIECNPLSSFVNRAGPYHGPLKADVLSSDSFSNGCPACRDFHQSFKGNSFTAFSIMSPMISFSPFAFLLPQKNFLFDHLLRNEKPFLSTHPLAAKRKESFKIIHTTILLI